MSAERWMELASAYVLGSLDPDERRAFEEQLAEDRELQREVARWEETLGAVAERLPTPQMPVELRERILREARAATPIRSGRQDPRGGKNSPGRPGRWSVLVPWTVAAAALAGAVSAGLAYRAATEREQTLASELDGVRDTLAQRDSLLATFMGPNVRTASLSSTGQAPSMHLFWNRETDRLVMAAFDLLPAEAGRTYQLWGIQTGLDPVSLGVFQTDAQGRALLVQTVPDGFDFDVSAVTDEPAGGSPQPTTTPFLAGSWSAAE